MTFLPLWMEIPVNVIGYAGFIGMPRHTDAPLRCPPRLPLRTSANRGRAEVSGAQPK